MNHISYRRWNCKVVMHNFTLSCLNSFILFIFGFSKLCWENPCWSRFLHKIAAMKSIKRHKSNLILACMKRLPIGLSTIFLATDFSRKMLQSSGFMYSFIFIWENVWYYIFVGVDRTWECLWILDGIWSGLWEPISCSNSILERRTSITFNSIVFFIT